MLVLMLTSLAGRDFAVTTGEVYECDGATGQRLIAAGYAAPLPDEAPAVETAMAAPAVEKAVRLRGRARG